MKRLSEVQYKVLTTLSKPRVRIRAIGTPPVFFYRHEKLCNEQTVRALRKRNYVELSESLGLWITPLGRKVLSYHESLPCQMDVP